MSHLLLVGSLGIGLMIAGTGCAFTNVDVHRPATPGQAGAADQSRASLSSRPGHGREVIVLAPFDDDRAERARCGMQKNGYNMDTADVRCTEPPGRWLADELAIELTRAGFQPLAGDAVPGPTTVIVRGSVQQLFLEPVHHLWNGAVEGDFGAKLVVTSPSGLHAERRFFVKGTVTSWMSTEDVFQSTADCASHALARDMVASLTALLDHYPDLGSHTASAPPRLAQVTR